MNKSLTETARSAEVYLRRYSAEKNWPRLEKIADVIHALTHDEEIRGEEWDRPDHYGGEENPFEPIKIIEYYDLNFNLGNAIKYVLRAPFKGTALEDLKKAYTYIGFEIRRRERAGETE